MKITRRGFTLVELLIVVAILSTLTAAMTVSVTGSTAKAKAATIASNVNEFVKAASIYSNTEDANVSTATTDTVIEAYMGKWKDLKNGTSVKYTANDLTKKEEGSTWTQDKTWCVKVEILDTDKANIIAELEKIPGFGKYDGQTTAVTSGTFYVTLRDGKVTGTAPANES